MNTFDLEEMLNGYIACALWSSTDNSDEDGGEPLDYNYNESDIVPETLTEMRQDCADFVDGIESADLFAYLLEFDYSQMGHDFWLTRNRHGAGFWDRGLGALGDRLTSAAHAYGEVDLYVGDDGRLYS